MNVDDFKNPSGELVDTEYKDVYAFVPFLLPVKLNIKKNILDFIEQVTNELHSIEETTFDSFLDAKILKENISNMMFMREALASSRIEGTTATMKDVLEHESDEITPQIDTMPPYLKQEANEIMSNYKAITFFNSRLSSDDYISLDVICECQKILLEDLLDETPRRKDPYPGRIREVLVHAKGYDNDIRNAINVFPPPARLDELISNFIIYINNPDPKIPPLAQIALAHYQFETIHPFRDGNGRCGRIIVQALLKKYHLINNPHYSSLSMYLARHKTDYAKYLQLVRQESRWEEWFNFFTKALQEQNKENISLLNGYKRIINDLCNEKKLIGGRITDEFQKIISFTFSNPIFTVKQVCSKTGLSDMTVRNNLERLKKIEYIRDYKTSSKYQIYIADKAFKILISKTNLD